MQIAFEKDYLKDLFYGKLGIWSLSYSSWRGIER